MTYPASLAPSAAPAPRPGSDEIGFSPLRLCLTLLFFGSLAWVVLSIYAPFPA